MQTQLEAQILLGSVCVSPPLGCRQSTAAGEEVTGGSGGAAGVTRFFSATQRQENKTEMTENFFTSQGKAGRTQAGKLATAK